MWTGARSKEKLGPKSRAAGNVEGPTEVTGYGAPQIRPAGFTPPPDRKNASVRPRRDAMAASAGVRLPRRWWSKHSAPIRRLAQGGATVAVSAPASGLAVTWFRLGGRPAMYLAGLPYFKRPGRLQIDVWRDSRHNRPRHAVISPAGRRPKSFSDVLRRVLPRWRPYLPQRWPQISRPRSPFKGSATRTSPSPSCRASRRFVQRCRAARALSSLSDSTRRKSRG